jgi:hypothetical protein
LGNEPLRNVIIIWGKNPIFDLPQQIWWKSIRFGGNLNKCGGFLNRFGGNLNKYGGLINTG